MRIDHQPNTYMKTFQRLPYRRQAFALFTFLIAIILYQTKVSYRWTYFKVLMFR